MSGAEVLGIISAVISIIDATIQLSNAVKDEAGLPPNFKTVAARLPLITKLLDDAEGYIERDGNEHLTSSFTPILWDCSKKATQLQQLFEKVIPIDGDSRTDRYIKAARTIGKGGRVETLMKGILDSLQLLTTQFPDSTSRRRQENLTKAIEEVGKMEPSLPDTFADASTFANHGSGTQNINAGGGTQYNSTGNQNIGPGQQYIGTNYIGPFTANFNYYHSQDVVASTGVTTDQQHLKVCQNHLWSPTSTELFLRTKSFESANWLFRQEAFREWQSLGVTVAQVVSQALLTIKGKAFTGKSVMMKTAVDASLKNEKVITLYHFFGGISSDPTVELLRDLLRQLLCALTDKDQPWEDIRRWSEEIGAEQCVELSSSSRLQDAITRILIAGKDALAVRIFIDAIDDCFGYHSGITTHESKQDSRKPLEVLEVLANILQPVLAVKMDLGICVSRRHLPEYHGREPPSTTIILDQYMNDTIGPFIRDKLQGIPDHVKVTQLLLELSKSGAHNFNWAASICDELIENRGTSLEELRKAASKVLDSHEALYCRALRSSQASLNHASQLPLLQIALGSFRRLTADEFRHAYAFAAKEDFEPTSMAAWERSDQGLSAAGFKDFLSVATGGLLEIVTWRRRSRYAMNDPEAAESEEIQHLVSFLHLSTETFLRSEKGLQELRIESQARLEKDCHVLLYKICGIALQKCNLRGNDDVQILGYACEFWLRHARICGELAENIEPPEFMEKCWQDKCQRFIKQQVKLLEASMSRESISLEGETSLLVLLSTLGCTVLLRKHIGTCKLCKRAVPRISDEQMPSNTYPKALSNAIKAENFETATYLLGLLPQQHINVLLEGGMTPLYRACYSHSITKSKKAKEEGLEFVQTLLARGADPCEGYYGGAYEYPLHLAIATDNRPLIKVLCRGNDPAQLLLLFSVAQQKNGWPALHCAVKCNSETRDRQTRLETLRVLLRVAPESAGLLRQYDDDDKTALELAEEMNDVDIIEALEDFEVEDAGELEDFEQDGTEALEGVRRGDVCSN